jgi:hypothetical protein
MTASWMNVPVSEKLHPVYRGDWHDSLVSKAVRVMSAPVPYISEWDENFSPVEGAVPADDPNFMNSLPSQLPPEIAELLFGQQHP